MSKNTGGPAFPGIEAVVTGIDSEGIERVDTEASGGMTLRDYFAAHCPISFEEAEDYNILDEDSLTFWCKIRYDYADKMILAGAK